MSNYKNFAIIFILIFANFTSNAHGQGKSLREVYKAGKIRFIPEFTIDETFLPEDTFFESAFNIKCNENGYVYVCDYKAHNIKIFDSSGKFIKTIGREGQGPGEFTRPYDIKAINIPIPFSPRIYWDVSPAGEIAIGYSKTYEIEIYGIDGEKITSLSHTYTAEKVADEDKKKFFASIGSFSGGERKQGADDFIVQNTEFPKFKPAFQ